MKFARTLRNQLARWIAQDSDPSVRRGAARGALLLETLESRQMLAGDVDLLATDPAPESTTSTADTGAELRESTREAEGEPGPDLVAFAEELTNAGVQFYGANWCPACTAQKQLFEDGGDNLPFTEVTLPDRTLNPQFNSIFTNNQGDISAQFPLWVFPDDTQRTGVLSLQEISTLSGVSIPNSDNERPQFEPVGSQTVEFGSPLHIPIDGYDAEGGPLTVTVSVADPSLLEATVLEGNRSLRFDLEGFGDMVFELFEQRAPVPAGRVADLADSGFYDGIIFHRVIDNFVLQAGDPTGTGTSGSNLGTFSDQFHPDLQHNRTGVLSFAKSSDDTNNSQFFITEGQTRHLDYNHSIFGQLVEGEDVREAISEMEVNGADRPTTDIVIDNATVFNDTENSVVMFRALASSGSTSVTITITDEDGNSFSEVVPVTLTGDAANGQPYLNDITTPAAVEAGNAATLQLSSVDVEGDAVSYFGSVSGSNASIDVNPTTGLVTVTPTSSNFVGTVNASVGVRAATGAGTNSDTEQVTFTFQQSALTAPTQIDLRASSDTGTSATDNVTNGGSLTFDITGVDSGATVEIVNTANGNAVVGQGVATGQTIAITTSNLAAIGDGVYQLAARQTLNGETSGLSPILTVTLDRSTPALSVASISQQANVGEAYFGDLVSTEEGSGVVYSLATSPTGVTIDASTGQINWTPTESQIGSQDFTVQLTDTAGNVTSENFSITVAGEPLAGIRLEVTDLQGNALSSVDVGDEFLLRMFGTDERSPSQQGGVFAAFADVLFDGTLVRAVPGQTFSYDPDFLTTQKGTISTGLLNEAGAVYSGGTAATGAGEELIWTLRMEALASGTVNFVSEAADESNSEVLLFFNDNQVPAENVVYRTTSLAIGQSFTALPDTFTVDEDSSATILDVLANDTVNSGTGTLSVVSVTQPNTGGTVTLNNGEVSFTPTTDFVGNATFTYRVSDSGGVQENVSVTVTVQGVNDPPTGVDDTFDVDSDSGVNTLNVLANEQGTADPGETLTISGVSATTNGGTAVIANNGAVINYTPPSGFIGTDTFTYTLSDGTDTDEVSVTVNVVSADNPPTANDDAFPASGTIQEDSASDSYDVLANDTQDTDGQSFVIDSVGSPSDGGTVSISGDGLQLNYQPAADFNGSETVTYTIRDTGGGRSTATATFTVTAVNDPPPISDVSTTLLRGDSDNTVLRVSDLPDNVDSGETITIVNLGTPSAGGTATIASDGQSVTYIPPSDDFSGDVTITFEVEDAGGLSSGPRTLTIDVVEFERRDISFVFDSILGTVPSYLGGIRLSGTNALNESVDIDLASASGVTMNDDGVSFEDLLPGDYTLNIPAIPFLHGMDEPQQIAVNSGEEEGDETVNVSVGRIKAQYLRLDDWFGTAPRRRIMAVVEPGSSALFAQPTDAAADLSSVEVELAADGNSVNVRAAQPDDGGTEEDVAGSASTTDRQRVEVRGQEGELRLLIINVDSSNGVPLNATTVSQSAASEPSGEPITASTREATSQASGEQVVVAADNGPAALASSTVADVFVPEVRSTESDAPTNVSTDAALDDVAEQITLISGTEAQLAADSADTESGVETFTEAVEIGRAHV